MPEEDNLDSFAALLRIIARLRGPQGCPWDRAQTHISLKPNLIEECYEVIETMLPCVITVDIDLGELRAVNLQALFGARNKPLHSWGLSDLNSVSLPGYWCQLLDIYMPKLETACDIIDGKTPENAAINLANRLNEKSLL